MISKEDITVQERKISERSEFRLRALLHGRQSQPLSRAVRIAKSDPTGLHF